MPIQRDTRDIPAGESEGNPPQATPLIGHLLAERWGELDRAEPHVNSRSDVDRYVRLGWTGKCSRDLGYRLLDIEKSNPPDLAARWRMGLGTEVHGLLQAVIAETFPGAEVEKVVDAQHDELFGFPVAGRTDLFLVTEHERAATPEEVDDGCELGVAFDEKRTAVEVKTVNGFGFKSIIGARGKAEGPRTSWLYQAAFNGRAHKADRVVIVALSLECLSDRELKSLVTKQGGEPDPVRKFVAEWTYEMAELDDLVDRETLRLTKVMAMVDHAAEEYVDYMRDGGFPEDERTPMAEWIAERASLLPPRHIPWEMPARARVTDPQKGQWVVEVDGNVMDSGTVWYCAYCDFKDRCTADGPS